MPQSQQEQAIIRSLVTAGAEAIILGCTDTLLIQAEHSPVLIFDTTIIHAQAAIDWSLFSHE